MGIVVRVAHRDDCSAMMELIKELAIFEKEPDAVTVSMEEFEDAGFGANPVWGAFVATDQDKIVGLSLYYIRYSTWKGRRLYLEDLIVHQPYRGQGIGKQLLDRTIEYAKTNDFSGMMWQVLDWNTPAIKFYESYNASLDGEWINVSLSFRE
ncbi:MULTISPECIES: GNAT family N-acetyltransferase [Sphingobacterium]|uniref:GNAT family N-acetyltransferase n=1 Tax=Sphingobacterium TaxID=28453 RepID=UPI0013DAC891|nr:MULTISPECIES: GNAT family N-acetyltransferase [unclassified Sphingobacterium]